MLRNRQYSKSNVLLVEIWREPEGFMTRQFQLGSLSLPIDDLGLAHTLQNGYKWYVEQRGQHQVYSREIIAYQLAHIANILELLTHRFLGASLQSPGAQEQF